MFIWRLLRVDIFKSYLDLFNFNFSILNYILFTLTISIFAGIIFGSVQYYSETLSRVKNSFKNLLFTAFFFHLGVMLLLYSITFLLLAYFGNTTDISFKDFLFNPIIILNFFYFLLINSIILIVIYLNKLFGRGVLFKIVTGQYYKPREERRIFMFLDLDSSTEIAEELGHIRYSNFIQDCFFDLSVLENTNAEIYQYVGDEVVITWNTNSKHDNALECLQSCFLFKKKLIAKREYYESKYGIIPIFKAGIHIGKVTVAEVGSIKREIAYHGDTINIASRVQKQCNELKREIIITEEFFGFLQNKSDFTFEKLKELNLRGKKETTTLYSATNKIGN